jgi:magnesium chelatase family protein
VLFLDELPEFASRALEALREPMESREISISRARYTITYPADFQLVAAMNPCPCGYITEPRHECRCRPSAVERYGARISGPLADRIDLCSTLTIPPFEALTSPDAEGDGFTTAEVRKRVSAARAIQLERSGCLNARLGVRELKRVVALTPDAHRTLGRACRARLLTGRGVSKVQKTARTLADLAGRDRVSQADIAMALSLRVGDQLSAAA